MDYSLSPIRVCHLGKYYPPAPGGIETHVRTLARAQADLGAKVQVLCMNHRDGPTVREMDGPVEVIRFRRTRTVAKLDLCPELRSGLANVEADILHLQVPNPTMILALLLARARQPLVVTYQSDHVRQRIRGLLFRPLERLLYRRVRVILPTSPTYAAGSKFLRSYADRLDVVPMGIDLEPYLNPTIENRQQAAHIQAQYPGPIWLACGRLIYYKGLIHAIRALADTPGTLLIVGDGPERPALEREAIRLAVDTRVAFLGDMHYQQVIPYYLAAFAFWFPSNARSEAFGIVQVEAMASGCPVINTALADSGVPWVSRHEETGLTILVNDPGALARAATRLLMEPGLRDRLSGNARQRACQEFDHYTMARRSLSIYRRIFAEKLNRRSVANPLVATTQV